MTMNPGPDALIEGGQSDALVEEISIGLCAECGHSPRTVKEGVNLLLPVRDVVRAIVDRLRAGGLSDTTIGATLIVEPVAHLRPIPLGERWKLQRRDKNGEWRTLYPGIKTAIWDTPAQACAWAHTCYGPQQGFSIHIHPTKEEYQP